MYGYRKCDFGNVNDVLCHETPNLRHDKIYKTWRILALSFKAINVPRYLSTNYEYYKNKTNSTKTSDDQVVCKGILYLLK